MQNGRNTSAAALKPQFRPAHIKHFKEGFHIRLLDSPGKSTENYLALQCKMRNKLGKYQLKLSSPQQELFASVFCGIPFHSSPHLGASSWSPSEDESLPRYFMYLRATNGDGMRNDDGEGANWNLHCPRGGL